MRKKNMVIELAFYLEKEVIRMVFITPKVENQIKIIDSDVKTTVDENGNIIITKKMDAVEIAELFDIPLSDVLNGTANIAIVKKEQKKENT